MHRPLISILIACALSMGCAPPSEEEEFAGQPIEGGEFSGEGGFGSEGAETGETTGSGEELIDCDKATRAILCCCDEGALAQPSCEAGQWNCPGGYSMHFDPICSERSGPCAWSEGESGGSETGSEPGVTPDWIHPCASPALVQAYEMQVASHVTACSSCHSAIIPPEALKSPGSLWYNPTNATDTVSRILQLDLLDAKHPETSEFLLKPLPLSQGGLPHDGGHFFNQHIKSWNGIHTFVMAGVHCLQQLP